MIAVFLKLWYRCPIEFIVASDGQMLNADNSANHALPSRL